MSTQLLVLLARSLFILLHLNAWSVCSVSVELQTSTVDDDGECVGGDVGLTNPSVLLQHRTVTLPNSTSEWRFLAEISPKQNFNGSLEVIAQLDEDVGVQFRLLQLDHGGGGCNCWRLERLEVVLNNDTRISLPLVGRHQVCSRISSGTGDNIFCGRFANEARGVITKILTYDGVISDNCPGDRMLISSKGSPLPASCDHVVPRM